MKTSSSYQPLPREDCHNDKAEDPSHLGCNNIGWTCILIGMLILNIALCGFTMVVSTKVLNLERVHNVYDLPRPDPYVGLKVRKLFCIVYAL